MEIKYLASRNAVIDSTTELLYQTTKEWIGMGRTAAWIEIPSFAAAIRTAQAKGVSFKVVIFFEGNAYKHFGDWIGVGAKVRFFEHGYIRLLIFDDSDAIIAFPKVVTSLDEEREYFGWHIKDEQSVSQLRNYFAQIWEQSQSISLDEAPEKQDKGELVRVKFAGGILRHVVEVIKRSFPEWFN